MTHNTDSGQSASQDKCGPDVMCGRLAKRASEANRKGLIPYWIANINEPGEKFLGVAYSEGPHDKGLMLNVCPWCRGEPGTFTRKS
ncbi:MAG: hypothetical protein I8H71_01370 [Xanthomonadaceae bacterium]|nr:hypothetical protein [Xanthomonadaceae bacterium]